MRVSASSRQARRRMRSQIQRSFSTLSPRLSVSRTQSALDV